MLWKLLKYNNFLFKKGKLIENMEVENDVTETFTEYIDVVI